MEVKNQNIICNKNGRNLAQFEFLTTQNAIQEIRKNTNTLKFIFGCTRLKQISSVIKFVKNEKISDIRESLISLGKQYC